MSTLSWEVGVSSREPRGQLASGGGRLGNRSRPSPLFRPGSREDLGEATRMIPGRLSGRPKPEFYRFRALLACWPGPGRF